MGNKITYFSIFVIPVSLNNAYRNGNLTMCDPLRATITRMWPSVKMRLTPLTLT